MRLIEHWYSVTEIGDVTIDDLHGLPVDSEPSQDEAARWGQIFEEAGETQWPALCARVRSGSYPAGGRPDLPVVGDFEEAFCGEVDTFRDFSFQYAEDLDLFHGLPDDHVVVRYFNWDSWISDLEFDLVVERNPDGGVFVFRND